MISMVCYSLISELREGSEIDEITAISIGLGDKKTEIHNIRVLREQFVVW